MSREIKPLRIAYLAGSVTTVRIARSAVLPRNVYPIFLRIGPEIRQCRTRKRFSHKASVAGCKYLNDPSFNGYLVSGIYKAFFTARNKLIVGFFGCIYIF